MALIVPETQKVQLDGPGRNGSYDTYSRAGIDTSAIELGNALSKLGGQFTSLAAGQAEAQEAADARHIEAYVGKARQEIVDGVPLQAQLGNILPEQSNVIRGRVAESLGFEQGQKWVQERYAEIMADENLIMNPQAFQAAMEGLKKEAYQRGQDDPAFGSGYLKAVEGMVNQASANATQMRTRYMNEVQEDSYGQEVLGTVTSGEGDPGPVTPTAYGVPSKGNPMAYAATMMGKKEKPDRETLKKFLKDGGVDLDPATTAWCAAYVNAALGKAGLKGTGSNMARSFLKWGEEVTEPQKGDIVVLTRGNPNGPYGHVGFYDGKNPDGTIRILGGNQGKEGVVSVANFNPKNVLGYRRIPGVSAEAVAATNGGTTPTIQGSDGNIIKLADVSQDVNVGPTGGVGSTTDADPQTYAQNNAEQGEQENVQFAQGSTGAEEVPPDVQAARNRLRHLDNQWGKSSSLNQAVRRKRAFNDLIKHAAKTLDASVLDKIPPEWITPDRVGELQDVRRKIVAAAEAESNASRIRAEQERKLRIQSQKDEIIQKLSRGEEINPLDYNDNHEAYLFAMKQKQDEIAIDPVWSQTNMNTAETRIEKAALTNDWSELGFESDIPPSREALDNWVDNLPDIKAADRIKLKTKIPELMEVGVFVGGKQAKEWYDEYLATGIKAYLNSPDGMMATLNGRDLYAITKSAYDTYLRNAFKAYVEDNGKPPTGQARMDIYDAAVKRAREAMTDVSPSNTRTGAGRRSPPPPGSNRSQPASQESNTGKPKGRWKTHPDGSKEFVRE